MQVYSYDRDANYGRSIYASDFRRGNGYDSWQRRDHVRDTQSLSWDRDQFPGRRRERSSSRGHDYRQRSRSPRVRTHRRSYREDNYDNKQNHEHSSVVPSATIIVMGLSKRATAEDLHRILAQWGPLRNVRVIKERNSSSCRGIAFIDFPSVVKARRMMNAIGYDGLVVDGAMLHFEYSLKKIKSKNRQMHEKRSSERRRQKALERATTDAPALRQQQHQYEEKVLAEVVVEEREAEEMASEEAEVEESEAEGVVSEEGEAEDIEAEEMVEEEGGVEESEAEEMVSEEGEAGDSEVEEMVSEEGEVEDSEAEEMLSEEGEAGNSEAEEMEDGEEKAEDNGEEGEVGEDMVEEEEEELGRDDEVVVDMNEGEGEENGEEMQHGRVSTKNRPIPWTKKETYMLKILVALLSRQRTKSVPWTEILRVGSRIFHPKRTPEHLREKDRRMRGDTHRVRTKGRMNIGDTRRVRTKGRMNRRVRTKGRRIRLQR
ncbi:hypothetical protein MKW92_047325 [Papaver armeniacum]|nr:hypothetical protein MKW92_047325 [Papaver armeniacum]